MVYIITFFSEKKPWRIEFWTVSLGMYGTDSSPKFSSQIACMLSYESGDCTGKPTQDFPIEA